MSLFADISPWRLMTLPFLECLVLVGIHSYLGIHVLKRRVIFVDLALAQIAAFGATFGYLLGIGVPEARARVAAELEAITTVVHDVDGPLARQSAAEVPAVPRAAALVPVHAPAARFILGKKPVATGARGGRRPQPGDQVEILRPPTIGVTDDAPVGAVLDAPRFGAERVPDREATAIGLDSAVTGGNVTAENIPGRGARFTLRIPQRSSEAAA